MIEDYDYVLTTDEKGCAKLDTPMINGEICAVIITSNTRSLLKICFADNKEIEILNMECVGDKYIPLSIISQNKIGEIINNCCEKYYVYNKLNICIENGITFSNIVVTLRVKK